MNPLLLAVALGMLTGGALAQNTKGTGAETRSTTTTNPGASVVCLRPRMGAAMQPSPPAPTVRT